MLSPEEKTKRNKESIARYYQRNKEKYRENARKRYHKDKLKHLEKNRRWKELNPEKVKVCRINWYRTHPIHNLFNKAKHRAKEKNLDFNISHNDITIPEICPILGIKLEFGKKKFQDSSPTLDRIDDTKRYIKGNIQVICYKANRMKNDATNEELLKFSKWIQTSL